MSDLRLLTIFQMRTLVQLLLVSCQGPGMLSQEPSHVSTGFLDDPLCQLFAVLNLGKMNLNRLYCKNDTFSQTLSF